MDKGYASQLKGEIAKLKTENFKLQSKSKSMEIYTSAVENEVSFDIFKMKVCEGTHARRRLRLLGSKEAI